MRVASPMVMGVVVGAAVAVAVAEVSQPTVVGVSINFWALVYGVPTGVAACAGTLAAVGSGSGTARAGLYGLAVVLAVFGSAVFWLIAVWAIAPTTLEGAWIWPLGLVALAGSALAFRGARRR